MLDSVLRRLARDHWVRLHGTPRVTVLVGDDRARALWLEWLALSSMQGTFLDGPFDERIREAVARAAAQPAHPIAVLVDPAAASRWRTGRRDRLAAMVDEGWTVVGTLDGGTLDGGSVDRRTLDGGPLDGGPLDGRSLAGGSVDGRSLAGGSVDGRSLAGGTLNGGTLDRRTLDGVGGLDGHADHGAALRSGAAAQLDGVGRDRVTRRDAAQPDAGSGHDARAPGGAGRDAGAGAPAGAGSARGRPALLDARSVAEATLHEALEATPSTAGRFRLNESLSVRFGPQAAEIDLLSRGDGIAIEIDGVHHFGDLDCYRRDRRKDLLLQTQGFVVVRLLAEDVMRDVRAAVAVVCQALAYRLEERR